MTWQRPHFVGIGGIGMSALARHFLASGARVTGTDIRLSDLTNALRREGAAVTLDARCDGPPEGADVVIHTAACAADDPAIVRARRAGIPTLAYAEAVGQFAAGRDVVAVAGTHGKTTTTAMLAVALRAGGLEPGAIIGGIVPDAAGNVMAGRGAPFVVEACEYRRSFLSLGARHAVITNISDDHLDYYGSLDGVRQGFLDFVRALPADGVLVIGESAAATLAELPERGAEADARLSTGGAKTDAARRLGTKARIVVVGERSPAARTVRTGRAFAICLADGQTIGPLTVPVPGHHNQDNAALAAVMATVAFGVAPSVVAAALAAFRGVERRFQVHEDSPSRVVVDDYAHHPEAISVTLDLARQTWPARRLVAVFQPHLASRTQALFTAFTGALAKADAVVLVADYRVAGRDPTAACSAMDLFRSLGATSRDLRFADSPDSVNSELAAIGRLGDVIVVMGAGDIDRVTLGLARRIPNHSHAAQTPR